MNRPLLVVFLSLSCFSLLQSMHCPENYKLYDVPKDAYQVHALSKERVIINCQNSCFIQDLERGIKEKIFDNEPEQYNELFVHPNESWIGLSSAYNIRIYNCITEKYKTFETDVLYSPKNLGEKKPVINRCLFHPHKNIILSHRLIYPYKTISLLDYSNDEIKESGTIEMKQEAMNVYCDKGFSVLPIGYVFAFDSQSSLLYMGDEFKITVFNTQSSQYINAGSPLYRPLYLGVTHNGKYVISFNAGYQEVESIKIFTNDQGQLYQKGTLSSQARFTMLALHPYFPILATISETGLLEYWHIPSQKKLTPELQLTHNEDVLIHERNDFSFSSDGKTMILFPLRENNKKELCKINFILQYLEEKYCLGDCLNKDIKGYIFFLGLKYHLANSKIL